jgi:uncharacterized protein YjiS (DUF1127 family)
MNIPSLLSRLQALANRIACEWVAARRERRENAELQLMSSHDLSDIGISHVSIALSARRPGCCA